MNLVEDGPEVPLEIDAIIEAAQTHSGLSDFGDLPFKEGLQVLIDSFRTDVWDRLKPEVRVTIGWSLAHILIMRLQIVDDRKRFPEISKQKVERPIFCIGMARSGSTLLHTLDGAGPGQCRFPAMGVNGPVPSSPIWSR